MADVTLSYKGSDILELSDSGSATLKTSGKYCEDDIAVEYVKPSSGGGEWTTDGIATNSEPSGDIIINVSEIAAYTFYYNSNITEVNCPTARRVNNGAFSMCTAIEKVSFPNVQYIGNNALRATKIKTIVLPDISTRMDGAVFETCSLLESADFGVNSPQIENLCFTGCSKLNTLILRKPSIVPMNRDSAFRNTPFSSGGAGGTIYIPKALYDHLGDGTDLDYKSATNWSVYDGYGTITWAQIEGSYYETHYADGTEIPT